MIKLASWVNCIGPSNNPWTIMTGRYPSAITNTTLKIITHSNKLALFHAIRAPAMRPDLVKLFLWLVNWRESESKREQVTQANSHAKEVIYDIPYVEEQTNLKQCLKLLVSLLFLWRWGIEINITSLISVKMGYHYFFFFFCSLKKKKKPATYKNIYNTFRWIYVYRKYFIVHYFRYFYTFQNVLIGINVRAPVKPDLLNDLSVWSIVSLHLL